MFLRPEALQIFSRPAGNLLGRFKVLSAFHFCFHETSGPPSAVPPLLIPFYSMPAPTRCPPLLNVLQHGGKLRKDFNFKMPILCCAFYSRCAAVWTCLELTTGCRLMPLHSSPHCPTTSNSRLLFCPKSLSPSLPGFCSFSLEWLAALVSERPHSSLGRYPPCSV